MNSASTAISVFTIMLLVACAISQQSWGGSATIQLKNGRTAYCPDHFVSTPVAVGCYTDTNKGKNIFSIPMNEISQVTIIQKS